VSSSQQSHTGFMRSGGISGPSETVDDRIARVERACGHYQIPTSFVAVDGDQAVGCASLIEHDMLTRPELSPWLAGVFVPRQYWRHGIRAALVKRVVREARSLAVARHLRLHAWFRCLVSQTRLVCGREHVLSGTVGKNGSHHHGVCLVIQRPYLRGPSLHSCLVIVSSFGFRH